jgi:hypothetical protein
MTMGADGTIWCCFDWKKSLNDWRISLEVIIQIKLQIIWFPSTLPTLLSTFSSFLSVGNKVQKYTKNFVSPSAYVKTTRSI